MGTSPGTSTITPLVDCTHPCTTSIIVTTTPTCAPPSGSSTLSATLSIGTSTRWTVPTCVTKMFFTVQGGAGGKATNNFPGGQGALIVGFIPVTPGQIISAIAGGMGGTSPFVSYATAPGGTSAYGRGGVGLRCSGGGGGASALYLDGTLLVVSGAGGGGLTAVSSTKEPANPVYEIHQGPSRGNAGQVGQSNYYTNHAQTVNISVAYGGNPGLAGSAGLGGSYAGLYSEVVVGNPGINHIGGDGVAVTSYLAANGGGGGGGGGGYFGGGSGSSLFYDTQNVQLDKWAIGSGGGGGSSFTSGVLLNVSQGLSGSLTPGRIVVGYS
ncbi:hypothetical protein DCS_05885 [Drechmeria coniospora]|uniref:Uncharacterized protein n=1 Tax=Drechmeria coniospora TaxID=98403 RepID=A0A151GP35_DRECN|nr:hypothetical protein DCS_05885 [Drechmeria coniospora]KYK58867.1 hypothetical protein DCS_05885 [Drechmeria coniospora]